jgi:hypothetical protein
MLRLKAKNSAMLKADHSCDSQARAGMWIVFFMGSAMVLALIGIIYIGANPRVTAEPVVLTSLGAVVSGAMTGLPSLMARMSGHEPPRVQDVNVRNLPSEPVPTVEEKQ